MHLTRRATLASLSAAIAIAAIKPSRAQDAAPAAMLYDVELIVFRNLTGNATPEDWSLEAAKEKLNTDTEGDAEAQTTPAPAAASTDTSAPALPAAQYKLTNLYEALRRNRAYQPLAHFGWTQQPSALQSAAFIPINSYVSDAALTGQVALARGRYLHLTLDLSVPATNGTQQFVIRESRRLRSNEKHYFDHPQFGVIALVTPHTP